MGSAAQAMIREALGVASWQLILIGAVSLCLGAPAPEQPAPPSYKPEPPPPGGYKPDPKVEHYGKEGGASMEGGFKFTDKHILDPLTSLTESTYSAKSRESLDIKPVNLEEHHDTSWDRGAKIGEGFHDVGPKDVGQEIFAKMEEAAQHALAIIEGAKKFTEEAEKEQSVKSDVNSAYKDQLRLSPDQEHVPGSAIEATEAPKPAPEAPKPAQDPYKPPETTTAKQY